MPAINQLNAVDALAAGDLLPVYSQSNGDARKVSLSSLQAYFQTLETASASGVVKQFSSPSVSGQIISVNDASNSVWLIVTPTATHAAGTIKLPALANCSDQQEILVNYVNGVSSLTINANGAIVLGAPTAITANGFFRLKFDAIMGTWYRVG